MITSHHNEKLKQIRKLARSKSARERAGRFVAEGEDLLAVADRKGWPAIERFCAQGSGLGGIAVEAGVLDSVSVLRSGTRALAVYEERWAQSAVGPLCVYLHGVRDPGNVGVVLRSAEAFGASCLALGPGCADPYGPKAVRASMGAVFAVPVVRTTLADRLPGRRIALVAGAGVPLDQLTSEIGTARASETSVHGSPGDRSESPPEPRPEPPRDAGPLTILIGAEREGLPHSLIAQSDHVAHIPILSHSLNAAMAAAIALYEVTRRMARA